MFYGSVQLQCAQILTFYYICVHSHTYRLIRLSSPKLNNITVFGVIILYVAMVLFAIPTHNESVIMGLCIARLWFLSLGVSLAFGTIIMKMFRVCLIFSNPSPKRKKVRDCTTLTYSPTWFVISTLYYRRHCSSYLPLHYLILCSLSKTGCLLWWFLSWSSSTLWSSLSSLLL